MRGKNEFIVGVTIVLGLIVLGVAGYWLTGRPWLQEEREVVAVFNRVGTLQEGNKVKYRGVTVGRVEDIALSERGNGVFVTMTIAQEVVLPEEPAVVLSPESLFGDWQAEIVNQSEYPALNFAAATRPGVLPGAALPDISELTAVAARIASDIEVLSDRVQLAFTEETAVKLREAVENVSEVTDQIGGFVDAQTRTYDQVSRNVLSTTENIRDASRSAEQLVTSVRATVDQGEIQAILTNARQASANLAALSEQLQGAAAGVPGLVSRADATVASFGQTAEQVNALVTDLRPGLSGVGGTINEARETLVQARSALATLEKSAALLGSGEGSFGRFLADPALYEETQRAITTLNRLLADVQANPAKYIGEVRVLP